MTPSRFEMRIKLFNGDSSCKSSHESSDLSAERVFVDDLPSDAEKKNWTRSRDPKKLLQLYLLVVERNELVPRQQNQLAKRSLPGASARTPKVSLQR